MRALGTLFAILVLVPSIAYADEADQLFNEGRALLDANNAKEACQKFEKAQKLKPTSVAIQLNLGLCNEKQGNLASARRWYIKTLATAAESNDPGSKDYVDAASDASAKLKTQVATLKITWTGGAEQVSVFVDGVKVVDKNLAVELDKGAHVVEDRQEGKTKTVTNLDVKDGEALEHKVMPLQDSPDTDDKRRFKRRMVGVGIAVGAVAVSGAVTAFLANKVQNDFNPDGVLDNGGDEKAASSKMTKITVGFFAGAAVGVAIGGYFFFTKPKHKEEEVTRIFPVISPSDVGFAAIRRF